MNFSGAPAPFWLLALQYVVFIMNRAALGSLRWWTPYELLFGYTPDISMIIRFKFYDNVYVKRNKTRGGNEFPSSSNELSGKFVGFLEHVGHKMTYKIITNDTQKLIYRSRVKLAAVEPNNRIEPTLPTNDDLETSIDPEPPPLNLPTNNKHTPKNSTAPCNHNEDNINNEPEDYNNETPLVENAPHRDDTSRLRGDNESGLRGDNDLSSNHTMVMRHDLWHM